MNKILINGTFDLLHSGHLNLIEESLKYKPGFLLILIDSDQRVQELKGNDRPIHGQLFRKRMLESLRMVNQVEIFDSDYELTKLIKEYKPDIMIKGNDYRDKKIIGSQYCQKIVFVDVDNNSTSQLIKKIKGFQQ